MAKRRTKPKFTVRTMREMASFFDVSYDVVRKWSWLPKKDPAYGWDLAQVVQLKIERLENSPQLAKKSNSELIRMKLEKEVALLGEKIWELEDSRMMRHGETFSGAELSRQHSSALAKTRRQLEQLPDMCAMLVPGQYKAAVKQQATSHLRVCLAALADTEWLGDEKLFELVIDEAIKMADEMGIKLTKGKKKKKAGA